MRKIAFILTFLILLPTSCSKYGISEKYDQYDKYNVAQMNGNRLALNGQSPAFAASIELNLKQLNKDGTTVYILEAEYHALDWMRIKAGESLIIYINNKTIGLKTLGPPFYYQYINGDILETANYRIYKKDIELLINAQEVHITLLGYDHNENRRFNNKNFKLFTKFYEDIILAGDFW